MNKVDERLILDDACGNEFQQRQQRQTEMIVSELTKPLHHYVQIPHRQRLENTSNVEFFVLWCTTLQREQSSPSHPRFTQMPFFIYKLVDCVTVF